MHTDTSQAGFARSPWAGYGRRYTSLTKLDCVVGASHVEIEEVATHLQDEAMIEIGARIDGLPGTWLVWKGAIMPDRSTSRAP